MNNFERAPSSDKTFEKIASASPDTGGPAHAPVLNDVIGPDDVPAGLRVALDARMAEKQALMDLAQELTDKLRPELDRLTAELVERTLQGLWRQRSEKYHKANL